MALNKALINELRYEATNTKRILERIPFEHRTWKPHEKSAEMLKLATHVAELPIWIVTILNADELNLAELKYSPTPTDNNNDLVALYEQNVQKAEAALENVTDEEIMKNWTLRRGDHIIAQLPKAAAIRNLAMNHLVHHRGQLTGYLRHHDVPVPGMYGPSADER